MTDKIEREISIQAPIATVWEVITKPEYISQWLGVRQKQTCGEEEEEPSELIWYPAKLDSHLPFPWWMRIASQALLP